MTRPTARELAAELEQAVAAVVKTFALKDARIAALEQEVVILTALLAHGARKP